MRQPHVHMQKPTSMLPLIGEVGRISFGNRRKDAFEPMLCFILHLERGDFDSRQLRLILLRKQHVQVEIRNESLT
jgi:hypothetical protein